MQSRIDNPETHATLDTGRRHTQHNTNNYKDDNTYHTVGTVLKFNRKIVERQNRYLEHIST